MLKKSSIFCNLHAFSSTTSPFPSPHLRRRPHPPLPQQCRFYAVISDGHSRHNHNGIRWPEINKSQGIPTPYQIFNQRKGSPYSKRRFYELVKMYHPDMHDHESSNPDLSSATKTERYRLVVAANDILSDPVRRGAYDTYGAGWNGQPDVARSRDSQYQPGPWGNANARGWGDSAQGPSQNATWEVMTTGS